MIWCIWTIFKVCRTKYTLRLLRIKGLNPFETKLFVIREMSYEGSAGVHTGHLYSFCVCDCFILLPDCWYLISLPAGTLEIMYCLQSFLFLQRRPALHTQILLEYNTIVFTSAPCQLQTVWDGFNTPSRPFAALRFLSCKNNFVHVIILNHCAFFSAHFTAVLKAVNGKLIFMFRAQSELDACWL